MNPRVTIWIAGLLAAVLSIALTLTVRLPLPFSGFAIVSSAGLAFLGTLTLLAWAPQRWAWTETDLLRHAFQTRHGLTDLATRNALIAISNAHDRATKIRNAATSMREDVAEKVESAADRLDGAAREIFYEPSRLRGLRAILIRSELIEDAAVAHAGLRKKRQSETEDVSRQKLLEAVDALNAAFDDSDLSVARGLLMEVEVASSVAETVLRPKKAKTT